MKKTGIIPVLLVVLLAFTACPPDDDTPGTIAVTGVSLDEASPYLVVSASETLIPVIEPENATNKNVTWSSSDETVATVSTGGVVTAKNVGITTITVTTDDATEGGKKTASCEVTVNPKGTILTVDDIPDQKYTGTAINPVVTVRDGSTALTLNTDYTVNYSDDIFVGTAHVTIIGAGNYLGSTGSKTFTIKPKAITFTIDKIDPQPPEGTPAIVVRDDDKTILTTNDYTVEYEYDTDNKKGTAIVKGKGNYLGSSGREPFDIKAKTGAPVSAPETVKSSVTPDSITINNFTIKAVEEDPGNDQIVEYAISTTNTAPSSVWQESTTFNGLTSVIAYYIFARSKETETYSAGPPSAGFMVITSLEIVSVPGGDFDMGKELGTKGEGDVIPVHTVTLNAFNMSKYQITQDQYQTIMGSDSKPSYFSRDPASGELQGKRPVEQVNWYDAIIFCNKLSIAEGLSPAYSISESTDPSKWGRVPTGSNDTTWDAVEIVSGSTGYRLPTEAQWEYAAKGGNGTPGNYTYSGSDTIGDVAWYDGNNGKSGTHQVGRKLPNGLGIYDMSGNVWEWCWDWHGNYSSDEQQEDPQGPASGSNRVIRGGGWNNAASFARSIQRSRYAPGTKNNAVGLRVVRP